MTVGTFVALAEEAAVAQHHAQGIRARPQEFGDVVGHVIDALFIFAEGGHQDIMANLFAVQIRLEQAQARYVERGALDLRAERQIPCATGARARRFAAPARISPGSHAVRAQDSWRLPRMILLPSSLFPSAGSVGKPATRPHRYGAHARAIRQVSSMAPTMAAAASSSTPGNSHGQHDLRPCELGTGNIHRERNP